MAVERDELRRRLEALGFDVVRFTRAGSPPAAELRAWLAAGHHAGMAWMERTADKRVDPQLVLPGARSVIVLGVNYWSREKAAGSREQGAGSREKGAGSREKGAGRREKGEGRMRVGGMEHPVWARYALHEDYHDTIRPGLVAAGRALEEMFAISGADYRYYVDAGPVLERGWAARAGVGFLGKNAMLISRTHGNWLLLAAILTRAEIEPDAPLRPRTALGAADDGEPVGLLCGKCTRCLDACPTRAFVRPGVVDARRCVSYLTIEHKGPMPRELRSGIGSRVFGCDYCLDVCPWNRFAHEGRRMLLAARNDIAKLGLRELLALTPARFAEVFRRTPIKRLKLAGLLRNACVAAGNVAAGAGVSHELVAPLVRLVAHESALVRAHAVWAVFRIAGAAESTAALREARAAEQDAAVLAEYAAEAAPRPADAIATTQTGPSSAG